jgi:hypothetical protein
MSSRDGGSVRHTEARPALDEELAMADKSPHDNHHARKSAKSIKEKRAERRGKESGTTPSSMQRLTTSERDHRRHA